MGCEITVGGAPTPILHSVPMLNATLEEKLPKSMINDTSTSKQCDSTTGQCWCLGPQGSELPGTRGQPGTASDIDCELLWRRWKAVLASSFPSANGVVLS